MWARWRWCQWQEVRSDRLWTNESTDVAMTSSGWDRADPPPVGVEGARTAAREARRHPCGVGRTALRWWLCDYHDGLQEGCEVATAALELVAAPVRSSSVTELTDGEMGAFGVETPVELTAEQIELLRRAR